MTSPVLFLGLGGTGKQTLMHLRRLYLDEYGVADLPESVVRRYGAGRLPHTGFLCLDSDDRLEDIDGRRFDELMMASQLSGNEFLRVELQADQVNRLYDQPEQHPEYAPWYDFNLAGRGIPMNGCGQTRAWGRLAFFQHYARIRETLRNTLLELINTQTGEAARAVGVNNLRIDRVAVFVVFSVAGGTGSGMFLDIAFLLRDLASELNIELPTEAILTLPSVFSNDPAARVYANGYAALLELEYYNLKRPNAADSQEEGWFPIYWPGRYRAGQAPKSLRGPVFEAVWLIGDRSRGIDGKGDGVAIRPDQKHELTAMAAEWLFLRNSPNHSVFGQVIDSDVGNYARDQMTRTSEIRVFEIGDDRQTGAIDMSCRYGAFGLSKIYSPTTLVDIMAGHRLMVDVIGQWLAIPNQNLKFDEDMDYDVRPKVLLRLPSQDSRDLRDEEALFNIVNRSGTGASVVDEASDRFAEDFDASIADTAGADLARTFQDKLSDFRRRNISADGDNPENHGHFARQIRSNAEAARLTIRRGLDTTIGEALRDPGRGFPLAHEMLIRLKKEFTEVADRAGGRANDLANTISERMRDAQEVLTYARSERSARVRRTIAKVAISDHADAVRLELERQIYQAVVELATEAARLIGQVDAAQPGVAQPAARGARPAGRSLLQQLGTLQIDLEALRDRLSERISGIVGRNTSILNKQVVSTDPETFYYAPGHAPITPTFIREAINRLYGEPEVFEHNVGTPWNLRNRLTGAAGEVLLEQFVDHGRREMRHVTQQGEDVLSLFDQQFTGQLNAQDYATALRPYVRAGTAWLVTAEGAGVRDAVSHFRVGVPQGNPTARNRLEAVVRNQFGGLNPSFPDSTRDALYFSQEFAAFPLTAITNLRDYRDSAYVPLITREGAAGDGLANSAGLHIELHTEKFVDLVGPRPGEASLRARAVELFIEAVVKRRIRPNRDRFGSINYSMLEEAGFAHIETDLGRYDRTVRLLTDPEGGLAKQLTRQVQEVEDGLTDDEAGSIAKQRILALLDYYARDDRRPIRGLEMQRCALRVIERLQTRWGLLGPEALSQLRGVRANMSWANELLPASGSTPAAGFLAAPELRSFAV